MLWLRLNLLVPWLRGANRSVGDTGSKLTHLEGALSKATYPADELANLDPADVGRGVWAGDELFVPRLEIVKSPFAEV